MSLFGILTIAPFPFIGKDLRLSAFMNEWKQQLCRDYRSCKESSTGRPARTMVLPLKSLLAKIMLILFGGAVYILMLQLLSYNPQEVDLRWMIFESESWWSVPFISAVSHNREWVAYWKECALSTIRYPPLSGEEEKWILERGRVQKEWTPDTYIRRILWLSMNT